MEGLVQMVGTHLGSSYVVWPGVSMEYELQGGNVEVKQECLGPGTRSGQKLAKHLLADLVLCGQGCDRKFSPKTEVMTRTKAVSWVRNPRRN